MGAAVGESVGIAVDALGDSEGTFVGASVVNIKEPCDLFELDDFNAGRTKNHPAQKSAANITKTIVTVNRFFLLFLSPPAAVLYCLYGSDK